MIDDFYTIDFETFKISPRPLFPPEPVSVAIKRKGKKARFYSWGHVSGGNNTTYEVARAALQKVWDSGLPLLFQNAKFDVSVAVEKMGLPMLPWRRINDTMYLLFLNDPYSQNFSLKPSAERYLGMPPEEQDAVRNWLLEHKHGLKVEYDITITDCKRGDTAPGAYIAFAPGDIVEPYCIGDVVRTEKLFDLLYPAILERGMKEAYDTQRELMPILLENEQEGICVNHKKLREDTAMYERIVVRVDEWICKRLNRPGMNIDSDAQLTDALFEAGVVTDFALTKTGRRSASKANLTLDRFNDPRVFRVLTYRNKLAYSLSTFMRPWLTMADITKGRIHTNWNQVAREGAGAVTGRLSSSPNFQNITKNIVEKANAYQHPKFLKWLPELPSLRFYVLPDKGKLFGRRDFSQQELRILAEFENDQLKDAYDKNPDLDVHVMVQGLLADIGEDLSRDDTKGFNFGILYGMGAPGVSTRLGVSTAKAKSLIKAWHNVMPGVDDLIKDIKDSVRNGGEIRTWGGRLYGMPPPSYEHGEPRDRDYVLLNYLIQGSGADATEKAMIAFHKAKTKDCRILASVHDELLFTCNPETMALNQKILAKCISDLPFSNVKMSSDGKAGKNWGAMSKWEDK